MRIFCLLACLLLANAELKSAEISFKRDIRPLLSEKCFSCHGPDSNKREADLRLDTKEGAFAKREQEAVIIPGDDAHGLLIERITSKDPDLMMPPEKSHLKLEVQEIELLKKWIKNGADYEGHWSFEPIEKPALPQVSNQGWVKNEIDQFILARLDVEKLVPSPRAKPEILYRRLHLDLTGLPPSIEEMDRFLKDPSIAAFEQEVDRLLKSPACAERLAVQWLDLARYADTNGYSIDDHREMWIWRDWVINAFQKNMPHDQFLLEQIAGDLIPEATIQQKIATGFLRNSMNTHEGGTIAEEYRVATIVDRIDTLSVVTMGLTMKCGQCHDHKYDPITMRDYYQMFAFFNNCTETGRGGQNGNTAPMMEAESPLVNPDTYKMLLKSRIHSLQQSRLHPGPETADSFNNWKNKTLAQLTENQDQQVAGLAGSPRFIFPELGEGKPVPEWIWSDAKGANEYAYFRKKLDLRKSSKQILMFLSCDNEAEVFLNGKAVGKNPDWRTPTVLDLSSFIKEGENLLAVKGKDWDGGSLAALLAVVAITDEQGETSYIFTDGTWQSHNEQETNWNKAPNHGKFKNAAIIKKYGEAPWGKVFERYQETDNKLELLNALQQAEKDLTYSQIELLAKTYAKTDAEYAKVNFSIAEEIRVLEQYLKSTRPTVMIMDTAAKRETHILTRGQYDQPGEKVNPGLPSIFVKKEQQEGLTRLDLAKWLISKEHPLTARVAVNRYWEMLMGTGIVKTTEDFGSQGEVPSHPELLDWLAADFREHGWDVHRLLKQIIMSNTWQQDSKVSAELNEKDPYNRLLARSPRYRLQAEFVRDNALAISGLLHTFTGGPGAYPDQPFGLWKQVSHFGHPTVFTAQNYYEDYGAEKYRRSMYTFWKRTAPPPNMVTFDAPSRETCTVRRLRTNTPLQALVLMNDPQYVQAAVHFAEKLIDDKNSGTKDGLVLAFRMATGRTPEPREQQILEDWFRKEEERYAKNPQLAEVFLQGEGVRNLKEHDPVRFAPLVKYAGLILNLDETMTRE